MSKKQGIVQSWHSSRETIEEKLNKKGAKSETGHNGDKQEEAAKHERSEVGVVKSEKWIQWNKI